MSKKRRSPDSFAALRQRAEEILQQQTEELQRMPPAEVQALIRELQAHQIELEMQNEELRRARQELELARDRYLELYDFAPVGYLTVGEGGLIEEANLTAATMLGVERGRLLKKPFTHFIAHEDQDIYYFHRREALATGTRQSCDLRMAKEDGQPFQAHLVSTVDTAPAADADAGDRLRISIIDVTAGKRVEQERVRLLREVEEERQQAEGLHQEVLRVNQILNTLIDTMPVGAIICDAQGVLIKTNQTAESILGNPVKGTVARPERTHTFHYPNGRPFPPEQMPLARALESGQVVEEEKILIRRPDGTERFIRAVAAPIKNGEAESRGAVVIFEDTTAHRRAEQERTKLLAQTEQQRQQVTELMEALVKERDLLDTMMEHTSMQLAYLDTAFHFIQVNSAYAAGSGYRQEELIGQNHFELFPHPENQALFEQVRDTGQPVEFRGRPFQFPGQPERGTTYWDWMLVPVKDQEGTVQGLVLSLLDVTEKTHLGQERERVLEELDTERLLLQAIINNAPEGIVVIDNEGRIVLTNPAAEQLYAREIPSGTAFAEHGGLALLRPDGTPYEPRELPLTRSALDSVTIVNEEMRIRWSDGQMRDLLVNAAPLQGAQGDPRGAVGVFQDITRRKRAERVLERHSRDLELLNRLGRDLGTSLELPQVFERVLQAAQEVVDTEGSSLWLRHEEQDGQIICRAAIYPEPAFSPVALCVEVGEGIIGWVAQYGESVLANRDKGDPRFSTLIDEHTGVETHSLLAVPLRAHDEIIGVLRMTNKKNGEFTISDTSLIETLAGSAAVVIENAQLYEQARQSAAAAERSRLANELHDAVSQTLFSASVIAESLPRLWERNPDRVLWGLDQLRHLTRGALAEMRTLLLELRPQALEEGELPALLQQIVEAITSRSRVELSLQVQGRQTLPVEVKIVFYRVAQEAINNLIKHAQANRAQIELDLRADGATLRIRDDGRGFEAKAISPDRMGLKIMRERAESIGATIQIAGRSGQGTEIILDWKIPA